MSVVHGAFIKSLMHYQNYHVCRKLIATLQYDGIIICVYILSSYVYHIYKASGRSYSVILDVAQTTTYVYCCSIAETITKKRKLSVSRVKLKIRNTIRENISISLNDDQSGDTN